MIRLPASFIGSRVIFGRRNSGLLSLSVLSQLYGVVSEAWHPAIRFLWILDFFISLVLYEPLKYPKFAYRPAIIEFGAIDGGFVSNSTKVDILQIVTGTLRNDQ
jgi:hypothetical protein